MDSRCKASALFTGGAQFESQLDPYDINVKVDRRSSGMLLGVDWQLVTDVSGIPIGPMLKCHAVQEKNSSWTAWLLKMAPIDCPETSVTSCQSSPRDIPEQRKSHVYGGGSLKSRRCKVVPVHITKTYGLGYSATPALSWR